MNFRRNWKAALLIFCILFLSERARSDLSKEEFEKCQGILTVFRHSWLKTAIDDTLKPLDNRALEFQSVRDLMTAKQLVGEFSGAPDLTIKIRTKKKVELIFSSKAQRKMKRLRFGPVDLISHTQGRNVSFQLVPIQGLEVFSLLAFPLESNEFNSLYLLIPADPHAGLKNIFLSRLREQKCEGPTMPELYFDAQGRKYCLEQVFTFWVEPRKKDEQIKGRRFFGPIRAISRSWKVRK